MSMSTSIGAFNSFESLVSFVNRVSLLPKTKQQESLRALDAFFAKKSYLDESLPVPRDLAGRFVRYDIPALLSIIETLEPNTIDSCRLLANISKVTRTVLMHEKVRRVYQAEVQIEGQNYWGWIPAAWIESSEYLKAHVDSETQTLRCEELTPEILFALEGLHASQPHEGKAYQVYLSAHTFALLWRFAKKTDSKALTEKLYEVLSCLDVQTLNRVRFIGANVRCRDSEQRYRAYFSSSEDEASGSEWFDKEDPYRSISRFVRSGRALPISEQQGVFSAIRDFFTTAAFQQERVLLDEEMKNRFACIELPFLILAMQFSPKSEASELIRFVTNVQLVTGLFFTALPIISGGEVLVFDAEYGAEQTPFRQSTFGLSSEAVQHKPPGQAPLEIIRVPAKKPVILSDNRVASIVVICSLINLALKEDSPVTWELALEQAGACINDKKKWTKLSTWIAGQLGNPLLVEKLKTTHLVHELKPDYSKIGEEAAARFVLLRIELRNQRVSVEETVFKVLEDLQSVENLDLGKVLKKLKSLNKDNEVIFYLSKYPSKAFEGALESLGLKYFYRDFCANCLRMSLREQAEYVSKKADDQQLVRFFNALSNKKLENFAKLAEAEDILEQVKKAVASASPRVVSNGLKDLLANNLPFENGQIESVYYVFLSMISMQTSGESVYEGKPKLAVLNFSLKDDQKKQLLFFFKSEACKIWIERDSCPRMREEAIDAFKKVYKIHETISIKDQIKTSGLSLSEKVSGFLLEIVEDDLTFFRDYNIYSVLYKHELHLEERLELLDALHSEAAKNWFQGHESFHADLISLLEPLIAVPEWLDAFKAAYLPRDWFEEEARLFNDVLLLAGQFDERQIYSASRAFLPKNKDDLYEKIYKRFKEISVKCALNLNHPSLHGQVCEAIEARHCRVKDNFSIDSFVESDDVKRTCPEQSTREVLKVLFRKAIWADSAYWLENLKNTIEEKVEKQELSKKEVNQMKKALDCPGGPTELKQRLASVIPGYWFAFLN